MSRLKFIEAIAKYNIYMLANETPSNTIRTHLSAVNRFFKWCQCEYIEDITPDLLMQYKIYLREIARAGGNSINTYFAYLRVFFKTIFDKQYTETDLSNHCEGYPNHRAVDILGKRQEQYKDKDDTKKFITKDHRKKMFEAVGNIKKLGTRNKLMIETVLFCGLRKSEVLSLRPCDITDSEVGSKMMTIHKSKRNKTRSFFVLNPDVLEGLLKYIDVNGIQYENYIFKGRYGGKMTTSQFYNIFKNAFELAGLPVGRKNGSYTTHDLRGTFITAMLDAGFNAEDIAEIVGHKDIKQTLEYRRKSNSEEKLNRQKALYKKTGL